MKASDWLPSEALYAFAGWLASRPKRITLSDKDSSAPIGDLVAEFCKQYGLREPRNIAWNRPDEWERASAALHAYVGPYERM